GGPSDGFAGAVWVFIRSGGVWSQQGLKLVGTGAVGPFGAQQGTSVALSGDGNTVLVGGPCDGGSCVQGGGPNTGAAWVFTRSGAMWSQQGSKLVGTGGSANAVQSSSGAPSCKNPVLRGAPGKTQIPAGAGIPLFPPPPPHLQ